MIIGGIDLSLTSTGLATLNNFQYAGDHGYRAHTSLVKSSGKKDDSLEQRFMRQSIICRDVVAPVLMCDLVAIEGLFSAGQVGGSQIDRCGLWWRVVGCLFTRPVPVITVAPTQVKKFATNNGKADKGAMVLAAKRLFPEWEQESAASTEDEADALMIAAVGQAVYAEQRGEKWAVERTAYREATVKKIIESQHVVVCV